MKTLIATLGTGGYDPAYYHIGEKTATKTILGFKALAELLEIPMERIFVFGTKSKEDLGLRGSKWEVLDEVFGCRFPETQKIEVPYGLDRNEHYEFFENVLSKIDQTDELVFDISHGFRSTPVIFLMTLFFKSSLDEDSFKRLRVFYGAFEAGIETDETFMKPIPDNKKIEKKVKRVRLVEMDIIPELLSWIKATERFSKYGISHDLARLAQEDKNIKTAGKRLEQLNLSVGYNSINTITESASQTSKVFTENKKRITKNNPAYYVAPKIEELLEEFDHQRLSKQQLAAVDFFARTQRYGQAAVALQEYLKSLLTENLIGKNPKEVYKKKNREDAEYLLRLLQLNSPENEADRIQQDKLKNMIRDWSPEFYSQMETYLSSVFRLRNTFAHAKKIQIEELQKYHKDLLEILDLAPSWICLDEAPVKDWLSKLNK